MISGSPPPTPEEIRRRISDYEKRKKLIKGARKSKAYRKAEKKILDSGIVVFRGEDEQFHEGFRYLDGNEEWADFTTETIKLIKQMAEE